MRAWFSTRCANSHASPEVTAHSQGKALARTLCTSPLAFIASRVVLVRTGQLVCAEARGEKAAAISAAARMA
jgi:hypothetical protein